MESPRWRVALWERLLWRLPVKDANTKIRTNRVRISGSKYGRWVISFRNIAVCSNGYVWQRTTHVNRNGVSSRRFSRVPCSMDDFGYMVATIEDRKIRVYSLVYEAYAQEKAPKNLEAKYINKDHRDNRIDNPTFARRIQPDLCDFPGGVKLVKHDDLRPFGGR